MTEEHESWRQKLRELYLTTTPDEDGMSTQSILFNWGKFILEPSKSNFEFYLATKDSIEDFITRVVAEERERILECLPEEAKIEELSLEQYYVNPQEFGMLKFEQTLREGFNQCRQQFLDNLQRSKDGE